MTNLAVSRTTTMEHKKFIFFKCENIQTSSSYSAAMLEMTVKIHFFATVGSHIGIKLIYVLIFFFFKYIFFVWLNRLSPAQMEPPTHRQWNAENYNPAPRFVYF